MKFLIQILLFVTILSFIPPLPVLARSGCCSHHGGVCGNLCCDGSSLSAVCGGGGEYELLYIVPTSIPNCPLFSRFNSLSEQCECYPGYVAIGNRCISEDQNCQNSYGFSSRYNYHDQGCECSPGYMWNENQTQCVSGITECSIKYGIHATYNYISKSCECMTGYKLNASQTKCISKDEFCRESFGIYSSYDLLENECVCDENYSFDGRKCTEDAPTPEQIITSFEQQDSPSVNYLGEKTQSKESNYKPSFWDWFTSFFR